jgi:hypothetical protein
VLRPWRRLSGILVSASVRNGPGGQAVRLGQLKTRARWTPRSRVLAFLSLPSPTRARHRGSNVPLQGLLHRWPDIHGPRRRRRLLPAVEVACALYGFDSEKGVLDRLLDRDRSYVSFPSPAMEFGHRCRSRNDFWSRGHRIRQHVAHKGRRQDLCPMPHSPQTGSAACPSVSLVGRRKRLCPRFSRDLMRLLATTLHSEANGNKRSHGAFAM